ncbi:MAG: CHASE domain-containing protein [Magnetococcus sp. YQC-5]
MRKNEPYPTIHMLPVLVMVCGLIVTYLLHQMAIKDAHENLHGDFVYLKREITSRIDLRMSAQIQVLRGVQGLFAASHAVERAEFRDYVATLQLGVNYPGIQGVGFSQLIPPGEKNKHVEAVRQEGFPTYTIRPEGEREFHTAIIYLEPFADRNLRAFGYDMYSEPVRRTAMARARDFAQPAMSGKVKLVQEVGEKVQAGFLIYIPVYRNGLPHTTLEERRVNLMGWAYSPFRMNDLMAGVLGQQSTDLDLEIYDGDTPSQETMMYDADERSSLDSTQPVSMFATLERLEMTGHTWTIKIRSLPSFEARIDSKRPEIMLQAGILGSVLLSLVVWLLVTGRTRALHLAQQMTRELQRTETELRQHKDHLEDLVAIATAEVKAIMQTAVNAIITIDGKGIIKIFNPAAEKIFGWRKEEVIGKNVGLLMEEPFASRHDDFLRRFIATKEPHIIGFGREIIALRKDGTLFPAHLAVGYAELAEHHHIFVGFLSDITLQKKNETELKQAKEDAEAGARVKAAFIANMSHEIRTPMNAVIGFAEVVMQDASLNADTRKYIKIIFSSAKALLGIINDILDVTKLESGKFTLETVCFHLPNALEEAMRTMEHRAAEKNLAIRIEYDPSLPLRWMGDPIRLRQVILNLVGNAIKFTEKGGVTVSVRPGEEGGVLHFLVQDSGIGMTPEQVEKVFEAFSQADASTTRRFGGTGLGTTISKQIVEMMGGRIWVESEWGHGSVFHFTARLPYATQQDGCLYEEGEVVAEDYLSPRLFRILLAEDIEANATLAMLRLKQQGHEVFWAKNGREAVDAWSQGSFDLILMDVMMPELDGLEATKAIRAMEQESGSHIPILALTASVMREEKENSLAAGMDGVEAKPIDFNRLLFTLEQIVPAGMGRPNTNQSSGVKARAFVDFSRLDGILDHGSALKTWKDPIVYAKALHSFANTRSNDVEQMRRLLAEHPDSAAPARAVAHALKGVAGNLAMHRIALLATGIEADLKANHREAVRFKLEELQPLLEEAIGAIASLESVVHDPSFKAIQPIDVDGLKMIVTELSDALDSLNPDVVEPIMTRLAQYFSQADLAPIQASLDAFDFDAAKSNAIALAETLGQPI